jgi:hypothetical protein
MYRYTLKRYYRENVPTYHTNCKFSTYGWFRETILKKLPTEMQRFNHWWAFHDYQHFCLYSVKKLRDYVYMHGCPFPIEMFDEVEVS